MSVAVVIRRPGARGPHALELIDSMRRQSFFAHVLALPVDTEIARVRGVYVKDAQMVLYLPRPLQALPAL